jgi:hypothetical protein
MQLFITAAKLLCIYTSDGILKNYNRRTKTIGHELQSAKKQLLFNMVHLFLYTDIGTLEYIIFNYTAGKLFDANGRF